MSMGGAGRRGGGRGDLSVNAEINVTSLIDVAFTLLVIFIITAPILQGGIEVRIPEAEVEPLEPAENPFILNIVEDGTVVVGRDADRRRRVRRGFPAALRGCQAI